jgi:hypothetical protein
VSLHDVLSAAEGHPSPPGGGKRFTITDRTLPQKLQRRIANFRGIAPDASLVSPTQSTAEELKTQDAVKPEIPTIDGREALGLIVTKRKYRRHPKVGSCSESKVWPAKAII